MTKVKNNLKFSFGYKTSVGLYGFVMNKNVCIRTGENNLSCNGGIIFYTTLVILYFCYMGKWIQKVIFFKKNFLIRDLLLDRRGHLRHG